MTRQRLIKIATAMIVIATLIGVYLFTPVKELLSVDKIEQLTSDVPQTWQTALVFWLLFFIGGATLLPIPLMALAVSLVFPIWLSVIIVIPGFFLAASGGYLSGFLLDAAMPGEYLSKHTQKIRDQIHEQAMYAVFALRVAPTPPFTVTSMLSGMLRVNFMKYQIGSVAGIMPLGLSAVFFGRGAIDMIKDPSGMALTTVIAAVLLTTVFYMIKRKINNA